MTKNQNHDFSEDNLDVMRTEYEPLLCDACKVRLQAAAAPLQELLNTGKFIPPRRIRKVLDALCPACLGRIITHKGSQ